ncbi:MAG: glycine/sarcosine/betaine reductase complex component C subunit beta, partial [Acidimicrobiales bacterium]
MGGNRRPVISAASQVLCHVPGLARHGSKPTRELRHNRSLEQRFLASLRSFDKAVGYPPHQAYLGSIHPRHLPPRPWAKTSLQQAARFAPDGEIMPEEEFLALLAMVDEFGLVTLDEAVADHGAAALADHPLAKSFDVERPSGTGWDAEAAAAEPGALALHLRGGQVAGAIRRAHDADEALTSSVLLENLACKASATLALLHLLEDHEIDPDSIDYVIGCSEEAVGDRYQRGGGNMAKAVAGVAGLSQASGTDVKNFCAAPLPAIVLSAGLVASGVFG